MIPTNTLPEISFTLRECLELWGPLGAADEAYRLALVFGRAKKFASTGKFVFYGKFGYDHLPHYMTINKLLNLITLPPPALIFTNSCEQSIFIENDFSSRILYDYLNVRKAGINAKHPIENLEFMLGQIKFSSPQISWIRTIVQDIISLAKYSQSTVASHPAYCLFCYRIPNGKSFCELHCPENKNPNSENLCKFQDPENKNDNWEKGWRNFIRIAEHKLDLHFAYPLIPETSLRDIQVSGESGSSTKRCRTKRGQTIFIEHLGGYIDRDSINRALWSSIKERQFKRNSIAVRLWGVLKIEYTKASPESVNASVHAWEAAWRYEKLIQNDKEDSSQVGINRQEAVLMREMRKFLAQLSEFHDDKIIHSMRDHSLEHTRWNAFIDSVTASDYLDDRRARALLKQYPQTIFGTIERFIIYREYFLPKSEDLKDKPGPKLDKNGLTPEERNEAILAERNIDPFISVREIHRKTGIGREYIKKFLDSRKK